MAWPLVWGLDMQINAELVKQQRQLRGWTQQHLSEITGISVRTIQRVETQGQGSHETISALASVFEIQRSLLVVLAPTQPMQRSRISWPVIASWIIGMTMGASLTYFLIQ